MMMTWTTVFIQMQWCLLISRHYQTFTSLFRGTLGLPNARSGWISTETPLRLSWRQAGTSTPFQGFPSENVPAVVNGGSDDSSFTVPAFEIVSEERRQHVSSGSTHIWQFIYVILAENLAKP